jgi:NADH:quinone reductase (non-electrogenic)
MAQRHKVVILGGGFGGLAAALALKSAPVEVTLVDRRNFHLFQPLLYQVATGSLSPGEVAAPLRSVLRRQKNTNVLLGEAVDINPETRVAHLLDGTSVAYDSLVVATGSQCLYFGHGDWQKWAPNLKSVEEALLVRGKIFAAFEAAERLSDSARRAPWLTFVIVGAGPTGVELAGALAEIAHETLRDDFRNIRPQDARIILMDGVDRILPSYTPDLSAKAARSLARMHVEIRTGTMVTGIDAEGVNVQAAGATERVLSKTVLWAGGIVAPEFARRLASRVGAETDNRGRMKVAADLTLSGHPEIFVVGDLAVLAGPNGKPLPGLAPVAMQEGAYVGRTISLRVRSARKIPRFRYFDKGSLAVIGRASAVADIFGLHLWGWPAWLVWLFVHLMYIVEFQNRLIVFIHWAFQYLTFSRGSRLITGKAELDAVAEAGKARPASPPA